MDTVLLKSIIVEFHLDISSRTPVTVIKSLHTTNHPKGARYVLFEGAKSLEIQYIYNHILLNGLDKVVGGVGDGFTLGQAKNNNLKIRRNFQTMYIYM